MSINITVLDLSKPRKAIINKYDDIMLGYKMKRHKPLSLTNKALLIVGISIVASLVIPQGIVYANESISNLSNQEVVDLFIQHMEKLHYSQEYIDRNLQMFNVNQMRDILVDSAKLQSKAQDTTPLFEFLKLEYQGLKIVERHLIDGIEYVAHATKDINPFVNIFEWLK